MSYILGSTVPLTFNVNDADGNPINADSATLTIGLPDGTEDEPGLTNSQVGIYTYDYVPPMPGRFTVYCSTETPFTSFADVFDVRPSAPLYMVSLRDVKKSLNMDLARTADDTELLGHIEAATAGIELFLHEAVVRRTEVEQIELDRSAAKFALEHYPVISITSVVSVDATTTWSGMTVKKDTGVVTAGPGARFSGPLLVTYIAGRSDIPANYLRAAEEVIRNLWECQRDAAAGPQSAEEQLDVDRYGVAIPPRARELLGVTAPLVA